MLDVAQAILQQGEGHAGDATDALQEVSDLPLFVAHPGDVTPDVFYVRHRRESGSLAPEPNPSGYPLSARRAAATGARVADRGRRARA